MLNQKQLERNDSAYDQLLTTARTEVATIKHQVQNMETALAFVDGVGRILSIAASLAVLV